MSTVLGLGFGDEGKGLVTSYLCTTVPDPIVVRFNGGHQAGHTVVHKGQRHVFSSFGSGTLQGAPTYWSEYCTLYPPALVREYDVLLGKIVAPKIYVNPMAIITTPFDICRNREREKIMNHGSVGAGFGTTIQRQEHHYKLHVRDLFYPDVLAGKLENIEKYSKCPSSTELHVSIDLFNGFVERVKEIITVVPNLFSIGGTPIYEGAQGILLDMDHGFFPNVTRSNTTGKNASMWRGENDETYYVTRSYATRHGNGYFPDECKLELRNNENETNIFNEHQGEFRIAHLNPQLLNYALECDSPYSVGRKKNLVVTCMDQFHIDIDGLLASLNVKFDKVFVSNGPSWSDVIRYK